MKGRGRHRQVWVKVNAPVDEGVAELVDALSTFPGLSTVASCQGHSGGGEEPVGSVVFLYAPKDASRARYEEWRKPSREPASFGVWLGQELRRAVQDDAEVSVSYSHCPPQLTLTVRETAIAGVSRVLRRLARQVCYRGLI
jgi:hypothetical protein